MLDEVALLLWLWWSYSARTSCEVSPSKVLQIVYACGPALKCWISVQICFGCPFSSKVVVCRHCLLTLSLRVNETLKWLLSLPILMQESFWWWQCSDRYIISLFSHLCVPFHPISLTLISLVVSVDIKHHVYLLECILRRVLWCAVVLITLNISSCQMLKDPNHPQRQVTDTAQTVVARKSMVEGLGALHPL